MKRKINQALRTGRNFKKEFRRQMRLLIVVTLGFTIAFTWRQTVFDISYDFITFITKITEPSLASILASTFITLVSIVIIYSTAHFLKEAPDNGY